MRTKKKNRQKYYEIVHKESSCPCTCPEWSLVFQEFEALRISRKSENEFGKVVSPTRRPHLLPRRYSWHLTHIFTSVYGSSCSISYLEVLRWNFGHCSKLHSNLINYGYKFLFFKFEYFPLFQTSFLILMLKL